MSGARSPAPTCASTGSRAPRPGRRPATLVARFSRLGEHAALWLALGPSAPLVDRPRRERWRRAVVVVGATYAAQHGDQGGLPPPPPGARRPARARSPRRPGSASPRARLDVVRGRARLWAPAARRAALRDGGGDGVLAGLPRRALPLRRRRGRAARAGHGERGAMKVGIVGMPNAGKSSLFNALTRAGAEAANYPFTTIEPNVAVVPVVDERLERVAETIGASNLVHDTIDFHDIAGLVRGAQRGRGPGQQVPGQHPRGRRHRPRRARPPRRQRRAPRGRRRPARATSRRSRPSCSTPTSSRPSAAWSA